MKLANADINISCLLTEPKHRIEEKHKKSENVIINDHPSKEVN